VSKRITVKRSANATAIESNGTLVWDFEAYKLRVHDGVTAGGKTAIQMYSTGFSYVFPTPIPRGIIINWSAPTESIIRPSSGSENDLFGIDKVRLNSDGTYAVVGASYNDTGAAVSTGGAYVFSRSGSTWSQQQLILPAEVQQSDIFGADLDINDDGDYIIAGASGEDGGSGDPTSGAGAAYIFTRSGSTWTQQAKLTPSDAAANDSFGFAVSISGDATYAIVGAYYKGSGDGAAYIFTRSGSTWTQQAKLTVGSAGDDTRFGYYVAMNRDGTYVVANASKYNSYTGRTHVFSRSGSTWTEYTSTLDPSDVASGDRVSYLDINADGDYVVLGAWSNDDDGSRSGSAYIFNRSGSTWSQQAKLTASDAQASDDFGKSVSISSDGDRVIVGAYGEDGGSGDPTSSAGAAYVFERDDTTWTEVKKLTASDATAADNFGSQVGISGDGGYAIAGAPYEDGGSGDPISNVGSAYIFDAT
jgi:hypothetical protein